MTDSASTNKRLGMLEALTGKGSTDPFAWYGLGMEYKNLGRLQDAQATFQRLIEIDAGYLAGFYMGGQVLVLLERFDEARQWFERGLALAREQGNPKTESEIQEALSELEDQAR
jgi:tetratricopeptide (TPR) repeat protein